MQWIKFIQKLFLIENQEIKQNKKSLKDLDLLDTVWIKEDDILYEGWIFDITRRSVIILYGKDLRDCKFRLEKPLNRSEITQNNITLYCNEPNEPYIVM